jgi:hypothetical protein
MSPNQQLQLDWLDIAANYSAGFGDTITFGGTEWIRDQWTQYIWGGIDAVNPSSIDYSAGKWSGRFWQAVMAVLMASEAAPYVVEGVAATVEYAFTGAYVAYWTAAPTATSLAYRSAPYSAAITDATLGWFTETGPPNGKAGYASSTVRLLYDLITE